MLHFLSIFSYENVGYIGQLSTAIYRQYWAIFSDFSFKRLSFAKIVLERLDTRYIARFSSLSNTHSKSVVVWANSLFCRYIDVATYPL